MSPTECRFEFGSLVRPGVTRRKLSLMLNEKAEALLIDSAIGVLELAVIVLVVAESLGSSLPSASEIPRFPSAFVLFGTTTAAGLGGSVCSSDILSVTISADSPVVFSCIDAFVLITGNEYLFLLIDSIVFETFSASVFPVALDTGLARLSVLTSHFLVGLRSSGSLSFSGRVESTREGAMEDSLPT